MTSLFQGAAHAKNYAKFRPTYSRALFQKIVKAVKCDRRLAVDFGCGTGQATISLAEYFDHVIGIDPSPSQLKSAVQHCKVSYQVGNAEDRAPFDDNSLSCITCSQAAHWFKDVPAFYAEANRVLKPGGALAIWCYGMMKFPEDAVLSTWVHDELYEKKLGEYWDPRRRIVERLYQDVPVAHGMMPENFDGEDVTEGLAIERKLDHEQLLGYLRSWSSYVKYTEANPQEDDPLNSIINCLSSSSPTIHAIWPVRLLLSVKKEST